MLYIYNVVTRKVSGLNGASQDLKKKLNKLFNLEKAISCLICNTSMPLAV